MIFNGIPAEKGEFPYQVGILMDNKHFACGGSIIDNNWVLTAARCVTDPYEINMVPGYPADRFEVVYGSLYWNNTRNRLQVEKVIVHPNWILNGEHWAYDITLLKVKGNLITPESMPVTLATPDLDVIGQRATVSGFGKFSEDGKISDILLKTTQTIKPDKECDEENEEYDETCMLCAKNPGQDTCRGDSGGPLVLVREPNGNQQERHPNIQVGIVSTGPRRREYIRCDSDQYYSIYTRVASFEQWIQETMDSN